MMKTRKKFAAFWLAVVMTVSMLSVPVLATDGATAAKLYNISNPYETVNWAAYGQYKAAYHTHSTNSDGANSRVAMIEDHYAKGFDILTMGDHDFNTATWDTAGYGGGPGLSNPGRADGIMPTARMLDIEAGIGRGDKGMINIDYSNEQSATDHIMTFWADFNNTARGSLTAQEKMAEIVGKAADLGGISHLNHPGRYLSPSISSGSSIANVIAAANNPVSITKYIELFQGEDTLVGMETINKLDNESKGDRILWDNILKRMMPEGRNVWGFSNDDSHSLHATGYAWNAMLLPELSQATNRNAMESGAFYSVSRVDRLAGINEFLPDGTTPTPGNGTADTLYMLSQPTPSISKIEVIGNSIIITGADYDTILWISGVGSDGLSNVIATGDTFNIEDYADQIQGNYVRAELRSATGVAYTNPFGIYEEPAPDPLSYDHFVMSPGVRESELGFTWTTTQTTGKFAIRAEGETEFTVYDTANSTNTSRPGRYFHKATAVDLLPSTTYEYKLIGANGDESDIFTVKTGNSKKFSFFAGGDIQIGSSGNRERDRDGWNNSLNIMTANFPDALFFMSAGDQVETASNVTEYNYLFAPGKLKNIPFAPAVGNHDSSNNLFPNHFNLANRINYGTGATTNYNYYYSYGDVLFIVLNTTNSRAAADHRPTIAAACASHPDAKWRIVMNHYAPYSIYRADTDSNKVAIINNLVPIFQEYGIDAMISGHCHSYNRTFQMISNVPQRDQQWLDANYNIVSDPTGRLYNSVLNPTGIVYFALNSTSGSKFYSTSGAPRFHSAAWYNQTSSNGRPQFSVADVSDNEFTFKTYMINASGSLTVIDSYTILKAVPVEKVTLSATALTSMVRGSERDVVCTIGPNDSSVLNTAWTSSNTDVVTVDENGRLKALKVGNAVITLTVNTVYGPLKSVFTVRVG